MEVLIDRDALITELWFKCREQREENEFSKGISYGLRAAITTAKRLPTVEAEPVVYGKWIEVPYVYIGLKRYICSNCCDDEYWKKRYLTTKERCCPNCGAKMDGGVS